MRDIQAKLQRTSRRVNQCWVNFEFLAKKVQKTVDF